LLGSNHWQCRSMSMAYTLPPDSVPWEILSLNSSSSHPKLVPRLCQINGINSPAAQNRNWSDNFYPACHQFCQFHFHGLEPQLVLAWDTMRGLGGQVCYKSKPMHLFLNLMPLLQSHGRGHTLVYAPSSLLNSSQPLTASASQARLYSEATVIHLSPCPPPQALGLKPGAKQVLYH
jgi:hypothetical protein